jgi:alpha-1,3-rhamnosyl/mannosyltransferase
MASGVPVVSYANSSLTEVVDDAGVLVPDGDVAAMINATCAVLDTPSQQRDLQEAGLARARIFSWDVCASTYADVFAGVAR